MITAYESAVNAALSDRFDKRVPSLRVTSNPIALYVNHCVRLIARTTWPRGYVSNGAAYHPLPDGLSNVVTVLEEARREFDRHVANLDRVRSRAQFAFTTYLALAVAVAGQIGSVARNGSGHRASEIGLFVAFAFVGIAFVGAASVVGGGFFMSTVDPSRFTSRENLAADYVLVAHANGPRIAALLSVYRSSIVVSTVGSVCAAAVYLSQRL